MAQGKSSPPRKSTSASKATAAKATGKSSSKPAWSGRSAGTRPGDLDRTAPKVKSTRPAGRGPAQRPPARKKKSIVNQKQTPWGLIISTIAVVAFAAAVVGVVVATHKSGGTPAHTTTGGQSVKASDPYRHAELPAAAKIKGVTYKVEAQHTHVTGTVKYDSSPPVGGDHNQYWANCDGNVYTHQLANENAVHMLEHGAVWITYNPSTVSSAQLSILKKYVAGIDRTALSPYAGLKTPISLQAWGYQLFVHNASDPRIAQFIKVLKYNPETTPENASCMDPYFDASKSTFGHPQETAA